MSVDLIEESASEQELCDRLGRAALTEIERRDLDEPLLAQPLNLSKLGVYWLLENESWPLTLAYRVNEALGLTINMTIEPSTYVVRARAA
jgi:hypothetical protein